MALNSWNEAVPGAALEARQAHAVASGGQRARWRLGEMVGRSPAMERLFLQLRYIANHLRVALIEGERGTGKLLAAQTLAKLSENRGGKLAVCDAAQFLSGSGTEAALEEASGGLLYLTHVDRLDATQQNRLLHLLTWLRQDGRAACPVVNAAGSVLAHAGHAAHTAPPRALLLAASAPLRALVLQGRFRAELYQQISAVQLVMPSLRDRREDISMLVDTFLTQFSSEYGKPVQGITQDALSRLIAHGWQGNIGELRAIVARAALHSADGWLKAEDLRLSLPETMREANLTGRTSPAPEARQSMILPFGDRGRMASAAASQAPRLVLQHRLETVKLEVAKPANSISEDAAHDDLIADANLDGAILRHVRRVLAGVQGNKLKAARLLGISRSTLYRLLDAGDAVAAVKPRSVPAYQPSTAARAVQTAAMATTVITAMEQ